MTDDVVLPPHAGTKEEAVPIMFDLEDLGALRSKGIGYQTAGFGQDLIQILARKSQFSESRKSMLTS